MIVTNAWLLLLWLLASVPNTLRCICPNFNNAFACVAVVTLSCRRPATYFPALPGSPEESESEGGHGFTDKALRVRRRGLDWDDGTGRLRNVDVGLGRGIPEVPEG